MTKRTTIWLLALAMVLGAALRIYQVDHRSLWFDEAFSWRLITFSLPEMITRAAADVHPPLYYVLLKGWATIFGATILSLRSFSITIGLLSILMAYRFAATAFQSRFIGVTTALATAVAGWQISYAWEARMYTLGIFVSLLSSYLLIKAIRQRHQLPWLWLLYALTATAFAYTHYFAFFTLFAHAIFALGVILVRTKGRLGEILQSRRFWWALATAALAVILYLPWIPTFLRQNAQVQDNYWVPPIGGWSIPDTFYRMYIPITGIPTHTGIILIGTALPIIFTMLLWVVLPRLYKRSHVDAAYLTVLCGGIPFLMAITVSFLGQSLYQDRFLVFTHVFILTAIAAAIGKMPRSTVRTGLAAIYIIALLSTHWHYRLELNLDESPGARAATYTAYQQKQPDEPVIVTSPFVYFASDHYALEDLQAPAPHLLTDSPEFSHFAGGPILQPQDFILVSDLTSNPPPGMWVIDTTGFGSSEYDFGPAWQSEERLVYPEVLPHQGDVILHHYQYAGQR